MHTLMDILRNSAPLPLRRAIGPVLGYCAYWYRTRVRGRTWEPQVLSISETLAKVREEKLSLLRFGDGELSLMSGSDLGFQHYTPELAQDMALVLAARDPKLLIAIPGFFGKLEHFTQRSFWFTIHTLFRHANRWRTYTDTHYRYGDAFVSRPYLTFTHPTGVQEIFDTFKSLWHDMPVALIEGTHTCAGVGNDLFASTRSIARILCPAEDAYASVDQIVAACRTLPENTLILLSLGPAAKVIGYHLFKEGYRVIDIGHLDMEYDMFLRNSHDIVPVRYKYANEINERTPEFCTDPAYQSQIYTRIS